MYDCCYYSVKCRFKNPNTDSRFNKVIELYQDIDNKTG